MSGGNLDPLILVNFLYAVFNLVRDGLTYLFKTLLGDSFTPYGEVLTLLITLTTIYILLEASTAFRRVLRLILAISWAIFIVSFLVKNLY